MLFFRAAQSPKAYRHLELIEKCFSSSFGSYGLCVCAVYKGRRHAEVAGGGHAAEAAKSAQGYVTSYAGARGRWTMPPDYCRVQAMLVDMSRGLDSDYQADCQAALAFAAD